MKIEDAVALIEQLKKQNTELSESVSTLQSATADLQSVNADLQSVNADLRKEKAGLISELSDVKAERAEQDAELYRVNKLLAEYIAKEEAEREKRRIAELKKYVPQSEVLATVVNEPEAIIKEERVSKKRGIKKGSRKHSEVNFADVAVETRYEEPDVTICPKCGNNLVVASGKQRYVVEVVPACIKVVRIIKRSYKCPNCNKIDGALYYPFSNTVFPGSILTPSFAAYILYHKYELGIPLNHLSTHIQSLGINVSKQSLAEYVKRSALLLEPIYDRMKSDLINVSCRVIHADETTLVISKDKDKEEGRKKSYVYVYASSFYAPEQINIYSFHETRAIDQTAKWLKDYTGTVICDDFTGYNSLKKSNPNIRLQKCFAHVRRRFADILKALPTAKRKNTNAYAILELISQLFKHESFYKAKCYTPIKIVALRQQTHLAIKRKLYDYVFNKSYTKDTAIYTAVEYTKGVWNDLWTYLDNGYVEITNNTAERAIKPFVIQRKVFQTAGSYAGAKYTTTLFSIIRTAIINNVNVEKYLQYLFEHVKTMPLDKLLPYSPNIQKLFTNTTLS